MSISANFPAIRPSLLLDFANTEQLDPRITFSRPTTATYYDANTTALAEQNLFVYSQAFNNVSKYNVTAVTTSAVNAPDGTPTANLITASAGSSIHLFTNSISITSGTIYTTSIYAQAGTSSFFTLSFYSGTTQWIAATFNLTTGIVSKTGFGTNGILIGATITAVGSWYRLTLTGSVAASGATVGPEFQIASSATPTYGNHGEETWNALGTETIYAWGAQLEQRSSVTAYNATTTTAITNYIPVLLTAPTNQARFDHNPVTRESLGLLIEQQSTNLVTYSSDYTNSVWTKTRSSIAPNTNIAPDGTQTVSQLIEDTSNNSHQLSRILGNPIGTGTYTLSASFKQSGRQYVQMRFTVDPASTVLTYDVVFDLVNGTVSNSSVNGTTSTSNSIKSLGNGWYLCSITVGNPSGLRLDTTIYPSIYSTVIANPIYQGNGYSGIYIWGAQLEALAFPTSYIPTVASQVTRSADSASMTGTNFSSWFNQSQGSLYVESNSLYYNSSNFHNIATLWGGGNTSGISLIAISYRFSALFNGSQTAYYTTTPVANTFYKNVLSYTQTNALVVSSGTVGVSGTPPSAFPQMTELKLMGNGSTTAFSNNGYVKKLAYYPVQLTATQLQSLTGS